MNYVKMFVLSLKRGNLFSIGECRSLTNPTNGQVSHPSGTTFGQTATYSCNTGYNLVGDNTRVCQATGVWSGSEPTCLIEGMSCSLFLKILCHLSLDLQSQLAKILSCNFIVHTASYNLTANINCYTNSCGLL